MRILDTNDDGVVSKEEIRELIEDMSEEQKEEVGYSQEIFQRMFEDENKIQIDSYAIKTD